MRAAIERAAPWLGGAILALPVVATRYPPMTDLPLHEGMIALLAHRGDAAWAPPGLYDLNLGHANQLLYLLAAPLALALPTDVVCKLIVGAAIVMTIAGAARLARHVGTTPWAALAVAAVTVGWTFYWGFLPNMIGLAALLWALPAIDRAAESPSTRRVAGACGLAVLVFFAHEASALALAIAVVVLAAVRPLDRRALLRVAPAVVVAALSAIELVRERAIATPFAEVASRAIVWHPLSTKLVALTSFLAGAHGAPIELALLAPAAGVAAYGVAARVNRNKTAPPDRPWLEARWLLVALALLVVYVAAPQSVNFGAFLYVRFLAPAFVVGVVAAAPPVASAVVRLLSVVAPIAAALVVLPQIALSSGQQRDLDALYPKIARASAVAVLHIGDPGAPVFFTPTSPGNRVLAERGGRLSFGFSEYPIAPLVVPRAMEWSDALFRLYGDPGALQPATDLDRFRYLLVHADDEALGVIVRRALAPDAVLVARSGEWTLFESTHAVLPLTSAEPAAGERPAATLRERIVALARPAR